MNRGIKVHDLLHRDQPSSQAHGEHLLGVGQQLEAGVKRNVAVLVPATPRSEW
jgi:hypothetical protein